MKKFTIDVEVNVMLTVEVEAETLEEATDEALEACYMTCYAGNGGYDKICGVDDSRVSIAGFSEPTLSE